MKDITVQALDVGVMEVQEGADGAILAILEATALPLQDPNTGQPLMVPVNRYQVPMGKASILRLIEALTEAAEKLPDPKPQSNLIIAGKGDEDRVADNLGRFTR